jgi:NADH-quinone oxidoreductase subunit A
VQLALDSDAFDGSCRKQPVCGNIFSFAKELTVNEFLPILIYFLAVVGFAAFSLLAPHIVAPRMKNAIKDMPYESGMDPTGDARRPLDIRFYLVAILFLIFDVELLLIYPYAVAFNAPGGIPKEFRVVNFFVVIFFFVTVGLAYIYARRKGVFRWRNQ